MTEPTNPLFEDEKAFLERKKLEYERALRGDVEDIKEHTIQVGKVALVGAGVLGSIWLLSKAFGGGKKKKKQKKQKSRAAYDESADDYFGGYDEQDQHGYEDDEEFNSSGYAHSGYADDGYADGSYAHPDDGFYLDGPGADRYSDDDDNGLSREPGFPAHSSAYHGDDSGSQAHDEDYQEGQTHSYASPNSYQARPYDDSRRLPHSDSFTDENGDNQSNSAKRNRLGDTLMTFAKSEMGRNLTAQAAALALALVGKAVKDIMPKDNAETGKNADLAASTVSVESSAAARPTTSAASDATAAVHSDDNSSTRDPLA